MRAERPSARNRALRAGELTRSRTDPSKGETCWRRSAQRGHDLRPVFQPVGGDDAAGDSLAVDGEDFHAPAHPGRILHLDPQVFAAEVAAHFEAGPALGNARVDPQAFGFRTHAEDPVRGRVIAP